MRIFIARGAVVVSAMGIAAVILGYGFASADVVGMKYSDASAYYSDDGATVVIATVVGDKLETPECIVTHWRFKPSDKGTILFDINCNAPVATAGSAGNSAMSPEGRAAKLDQKRATNITKHPDQCETSALTVEYCTQLCARTELCSYP
jgi:hypothetical protein